MADQRWEEAHDDYMLEKRMRLARRRNCLAQLYTLYARYESCSRGIQMLIDYVIQLEDTVSPTLGMEMKSYDGVQ